MSGQNGWDKIDGDPNIIDPFDESNKFNGTDPISPERAYGLLNRINESISELVYGVKPIEKDESGFPKSPEGVMAIYYLAQAQKILGNSNFEEIRDKWYGDNYSDYEQGESPDQIDPDDEYIPSIKEQYHHNSDKYDRVVKEFLGIKK